MRFGSEVWKDGNTANSDECKTPESDGETSNRTLVYDTEIRNNLKQKKLLLRNKNNQQNLKVDLDSKYILF